MQSSDSKPLTRYRIRFILPGAAWLVPHEVKAVSLEAAREWAYEQYDEMWDAEIYDITPLS